MERLFSDGKGCPSQRVWHQGWWRHQNVPRKFVERIRRERAYTSGEARRKLIASKNNGGGNFFSKKSKRPGKSAALERSGQEAEGGSVLHIAAATVFEWTENGSEEDNFAELGWMEPEETANDVTLGRQLDG